MYVSFKARMRNHFRTLYRCINDDYIIQNDNEGRILMTSKTLEKIKAFGKDQFKQDALEALLDYYGQTALINISEVQALVFLHKLESGEIKI